MAYGNGGGSGTAVGGSLNNKYAASAPTPIESIPLMLNEQEQEVEHLHQTIDQLTDRLGLILAPEPANAVPGKEQTAAPSGVLYRVRDYNRKIAMARARLVTLIERVQL